MYTGLQLSKLVLSETGEPMTSERIWSYAVEKGYDKQCGVSGKTPWRTIQSQLYVNIRDRPDSVFVQTSRRPPTFGLKGADYTGTAGKGTDESGTRRASRVLERDIHPLLVSYLDSDPHFRGHTKTILHESSTKSSKNAEKWMHPDLVSVHFPFEDLDGRTVELARNSGQTGIMLYSFEMKVRVTGSNVRECFFQAVSNSSWANEGYLVALDFTEDAIDQLSRLSPSFGIGAIRLNADDVHQSEILFPSATRDFADFVIVNELLGINPDFRAFIEAINDSMKTQRVIKADYDAVMSDEELNGYVKGRHISS